MLVVGDLMCDHYLWGDVTRISPEAPVQVLQWEHEDKRAGGAANVALNLASLGCEVRLAGLVGADDDGRWLLAALDRAGVDSAAVITSRTRPTTRKLRSSRGASSFCVSTAKRADRSTKTTRVRSSTESDESAVRRPASSVRTTPRACSVQPCSTSSS